ncbi:MAG: hypothetical protein V4484_07140 [Pseudomonadota bacterium]
MNIIPMLGATLLLALLCGCKKPADKVDAPKSELGDAAAAALHAPLDKAKGVEQTLEKSAQDSADKIKAATDDASNADPDAVKK